MEELARRFRLAAGRRVGLRYPLELRQLAVQYASAAAGSWSRREIAAALGLSEATLIRWQRSEVVASCALSLREVVVVDQADESRRVLIMPSGVRVEGLSVPELVSVLGALG